MMGAFRIPGRARAGRFQPGGVRQHPQPAQLG
jgi:hypothetical protein